MTAAIRRAWRMVTDGGGRAALRQSTTSATCAVPVAHDADHPG